MRNTWILVNGTRVYLDPEALAEGELLLADADVFSERCKGCGEDILKTSSVSYGFLGPWVVCECGTSYPVEYQ